MKAMIELRDAVAALMNAKIWDYDEPFEATTDYVPENKLTADKLFVSVMYGAASTRDDSPKRRTKWDHSATIQLAKKSRETGKEYIDHLVEFAGEVADFFSDQTDESVTKQLSLPCGKTLRQTGIEIIPTDPTQSDKTAIAHVVVTYMEL